MNPASTRGASRCITPSLAVTPAFVLSPPAWPGGGHGYHLVRPVQLPPKALTRKSPSNSSRIAGEDESASTTTTISSGNNWTESLEGGFLPDEVCADPALPIGSDQGKKSFSAALRLQSGATHTGRPSVVGHRGSLYDELENTVQSFVTSHHHGCDGVEMDVFLLKCDTLVVFHGGGTDQNPGCLEQYCNRPGESILDYTAAEARKLLTFNHLYDEFGCGPERIIAKKELGLAYVPTLREVMIRLRDETNMFLKLELKGPGTAEPVVALVEELGMVDRCHFSSFNHARIRRVRELRPERGEDGQHVYKTGALFAKDLPDDFVQLALDAGASEIHLRYDTCTPERISDIHKNGMNSMCWFRGPRGMRQDCTEEYLDVGNEDPSMYRLVMATGVRSMCINRPDVLLALVGKRHETLEA